LIELIAFGKTGYFSVTDIAESLGVNIYAKRALLGVWILGCWVLGAIKLEY
jgi:hypothetical protein